MGTSNFLYNHKLDVISGTLFSTFDLEAYNKEMDEVDRRRQQYRPGIPYLYRVQQLPHFGRM